MQWLYRTFIGVARRYGEDILNARPVPLTGRVLYALGEFLIYGPIKNRLGFSNIRVAYTAGEAIGPDLFQFYRSLGMNLKQLYGNRRQGRERVKLAQDEVDRRGRIGQESCRRSLTHKPIPICG